MKKDYIITVILASLFPFLCLLLMSSCFITGRTVHVTTPRVDMSADTIAAFTIPYGTKFANP